MGAGKDGSEYSLSFINPVASTISIILIFRFLNALGGVTFSERWVQAKMDVNILYHTSIPWLAQYPSYSF